MKKTFIAAYLLLVCLACSFAQSASDSLSGPKVWLCAERGSITGTTWQDVSFFKNDAVATSGLYVPSSTLYINYNKALVFDGIDDYFKIPYNLEGLAELTVLAVFQSSDTTERGVWGTEQSLSRNILLTTRRALGPDTVFDVFGKNERNTILNSVLQTWEKSTINSSAAFVSLGSAGKAKGFKPFKGSLAELLVFNRALSFLERVQYETYLAIKYGTGLHSGNLVSSGSKVLWHAERNLSYGKHIAGIGRDDFFSLYQKQSGSAYDSGLLIMNAGALAPSNAENTATIADQNFLVWGSNGLPLNTKRGAGPDSILSVVQRKWLMTSTGNVANKLPVELHVDIAKFPSNPLGYWLVIDRSGTSNFSIDNLEYVLPDRVSNGKVIYKNILWDKDLSGKDNFGFAKAQSLLAVVRTLANPSCTNESAGKVKIEVIAGKAPYNYKFSNKGGDIAREWKQSTTSFEQKDLTKGDYTLSLKDGSGESLLRNFKLTMPDALHITLGPDQKISTTNPISLDVSNQVPDSIKVSYRWENSFGFTSTDKKIVATEPGVYRVFVTKAKDGCVFTDDVAITGAESQRVAVYPNIIGASEDYNVSISLDKPGDVTVKVYNARGLHVQGMSDKGNSEYQFITNLKDSGIYLVVIQTRKGIETRKLVVL